MNVKATIDFRIDKECRDLIPPLSDEVFTRLEALIIEEGVRGPLVVWCNNGNRRESNNANPGFQF